MRYTVFWGKREEKVGERGMENLSRELHRLREENSEVMDVLDTYRALRRDYRKTQEARRIPYGNTPAAGSSANVVITVGKPTSLSNY